MSSNRGSMVVESVILAPVFVLFLVFVTFAGRVAATKHELNLAADVAAREASMSRSGSMINSAVEAARISMLEHRSSCRSFHTRVKKSIVSGVTQVEVVTSCRVDIAGLSLLGVHTPTLKSTSREVIDVYRHP